MHLLASLKSKMMVGFGTLIVALGVVVVGGYSGITEMADAVERLHREEFRSSVSMALLNGHVSGVRAALLRLMMTKDPAQRESARKTIAKLTAMIDAEFETLSPAVQIWDDLMTSEVAEARGVWNAFRQTRDTELIPAIDAGRVADAQGLAFGIQQERYEKISDIVGGLIKREDVEANVLGALVINRRDRLITIFGLAAAFSFAACFAMIFVLKRAGYRIRVLTQVTSKIATDGDLTQVVVVESRDEVGQLAAAFALMVGSLREVLGSLGDTMISLTEAGKVLALVAEQHGVAVTRQATALHEMQVTAQELKQTTQISAGKAVSILEIAQRADSVTMAGEVAIARSLTGMVEIRAQVGEIEQTIGQLRARANLVGEITAAVKDLADQSNMLALNAAIEAVRSGEHGKGFSVVAREIRSLADQSIVSTRRVQDILGEISKGVQGAVEITATGSKKLEVGLEQMRVSGDSVRELAGIVKETTGAVRQIAAVANQQASGVAQLFIAVSDQTAMMNETVGRVAATNQAATAIQERLAKVSTVMGRFRLSA